MALARLHLRPTQAKIRRARAGAIYDGLLLDIVLLLHRTAAAVLGVCGVFEASRSNRKNFFELLVHEESRILDIDTSGELGVNRCTLKLEVPASRARVMKVKVKGIWLRAGRAAAHTARQVRVTFYSRPRKPQLSFSMVDAKSDGQPSLLYPQVKPHGNPH